MEFKSYSSLENHYNSKFISKIRELALDTGDWVAREKIHGTNFSVLIDADNIIPAKRSGIIASSESFFGHDIIMKKYADQFKTIQKAIFSDWAIKSIQIFGEFAGGGIQKEVDYGEKDFYVFDIAYVAENNWTYLDDKSVESLCNYYGLKIAPLIGRGSFEELSQLPNDFQSLVHRYNSMANTDLVQANSRTWELELASDNVSEGFVLKPNVPAWLPNGARVAIKSKNSKFTEKKKSDRPIAPPKQLSEIDLDVFGKFVEYATWNRVSNVASKLGELTAKDFGKVTGLTMQDIFTEASREGLEITQAEDPALVKKNLQKVVTDVIRERWSELLSG